MDFIVGRVWGRRRTELQGKDREDDKGGGRRWRAKIRLIKEGKRWILSLNFSESPKDLFSNVNSGRAKWCVPWFSRAIYLSDPNFSGSILFYIDFIRYRNNRLIHRNVYYTILGPPLISRYRLSDSQTLDLAFYMLSTYSVDPPLGSFADRFFRT